MTIAESVIAWLKGWEGGMGAGDMISTDQLAAAPSEACGVFRSPGDTATEFVDGSRDVTARFLFLVRLPAQTDGMRRENQARLEDFERWVRRQNMARNLPRLDGGGDGGENSVSRSCHAVRLADGFAMEAQTETEAVYQAALEVSYFEEAKK